MLILVNEAAAPLEDPEKVGLVRADVFHADMTATRTETGLGDQDRSDEYEEALQKALFTTRFEGLRETRNTFLITTQVTTTNVISTVVTVLAYVDTRHTRKDLSTPLLAASDRNHKPRETVYGAPKSLSKRVTKPRGATPHQVHLPVFRRTLPALLIPTRRLHREQLLERDAFMAQLIREREEKRQLESWAATRIQACFRGYRNRPRVVAYVRRMKKQALRSASAIRLALADMEDKLQMRGDLLEKCIVNGEETLQDWRQGIRDQARRKRGVISRQEEGHNAAVCVQSCVRRFLAKIAYRYMVARARDERQILAVVRLQRIYRGHYLRTWIYLLVKRVKHCAAVQIQALVRGSQAREHVSMLQFERNCEARRRAGLPYLTTALDSDDRPTSLKVLYENRKSRASLEFKSAKWHQERMFLQIYNISQKLAARRARLVFRWNWTRKVVLDKRRQRRVKKVVSMWSRVLPGRTKNATRGQHHI